MITLEINGTQYTHFTNLTVSSFLDSVADEFSITATANELSDYPIKVGQGCRVLIYGAPIVSGFVESVSPSYDIQSHTIAIKGSDKTVDVVDTTCGDNMVFRGALSFKAFVESALAQSGVTGISVIDAVGGIKPLVENEIQAPTTGESLFAFIERHARKRQILIGSNGDGNIELTRSSTTLISNWALINRKNDGSNTVLSASASIDYSSRYYKYVVKGQASPVFNINIDENTENMANKEGVAFDPAIRKSRVLVMQAESGNTAADFQARANYEANIRRIDSESYQCVVQGHVIPGTTTPIPVNRLIKVEDIQANINANLLINRVVYKLDNGAKETEIGLVDADAYTVQATKPQQQQRSNRLFDQLKAT